MVELIKVVLYEGLCYEEGGYILIRGTEENLALAWKPYEGGKEISFDESLCLEIYWSCELDVADLNFMIRHAPFVVLKVMTSTHAIYGTVVQIARLYGWDWTYPLQLGRIVLGVESRWGRMVDIPRGYASTGFEPKKEVVAAPRPIFFSVHGPTAQEVDTYEGTGKILSEIPTSDCVFLVASASTGTRCEIPLSVRSVFLLEFVKQAAETHLTDANYYKMSLDSYSMWSYPIHAAQVRDILSNVPLTTMVIAPGDGIGVVARNWNGPVLSGDHARTGMSSPKMKCEDMKATIHSGLGDRATSKVFVFSYCWEWVTRGLKELIYNSNIPVIVLQATNNFSDSQFTFEQKGPGLFGYLVPPEWKLHVKKAEQFRQAPSILFSENLLQNDGYYVRSFSDYLTYYRTMSPRGMIVARDGFTYMGERGEISTAAVLPWLAATLDELFIIHFQHPSARIYFAPIGKFFDGTVLVDASQLMERGAYVFPIRTVLVVTAESPFRAIAESLPHFETPGYIFFYCSVIGDHLSPLHYGFIDYLGTARISVRFATKVVPQNFVAWTENRFLISDGRNMMRGCSCILDDRQKVNTFMAKWAMSTSTPMDERFIREVYAGLSRPLIDADAFIATVQEGVISASYKPMTGLVMACGMGCMLCRPAFTYSCGPHQVSKVMPPRPPVPESIVSAPILPSTRSERAWEVLASRVNFLEDRDRHPPLVNEILAFMGAEGESAEQIRTWVNCFLARGWMKLYARGLHEYAVSLSVT